MDNNIVVEINSNDAEFQRELARNFKETINLANIVTGKWASLARKASEIEKSRFDIGRRPSIYWYKGKWKKTNSYWDAKTGAFRTKNRKSGKKINNGQDDFLLERFHFTSIARNPYRPLVSTAVVTSLLANLHENSVVYPKGSIAWSKNGRNWKRYPKGYTKRGRSFFSSYKSVALANLDKATSEGLQIWRNKVGKDAKV